jgi:hypothetical protein
MSSKEAKGKLFISYSHKDEKWMKELTTFLKVMKIHAHLNYWIDTDIRAGDEWYGEIETAIREADAAVLLISADFLASDFIQEEEIPRILQKREENKLKIFPLIVHHCPWDEVDWLKALQVLPKAANPLADMTKTKRNKALTDFAYEINAILKGKEKKRKKQESGGTPPRDKEIGVEVDTVDMPDTGAFFLGREKELKILDNAWVDQKTRIICFTAWGGAGKTSLVNHWLKKMEEQQYKGARKVYAKSFYSQGAEEGKQESAEGFIRELLERFGDPDPDKGTAAQQGRRLADLARNVPSLLVLDGLEPLQYPVGEAHGFDGRLKDRGIEFFLKAWIGGTGTRIGSNDNNCNGTGLVVITTRQPLGGLNRFKGVGLPIHEHGLDELDTAVGVELLRRYGVRGSDADMERAVKEYDGHALALNLLGGYLTGLEEYDGDIRRRDEIPALIGAENEQGGHARRVLAAYETRLGDTAEHDILRLMGLFDRPAPAGALEKLLEPPAIPSVTDRLVGITRKQYRWSVSKLRRARLLASANETRPGELDCHPLIREHFAHSLSDDNREGWQEAHRRLYEYFKALPEKYYPDTLEEMAPLFSAVAHGCRAGMYFDVMDNVYYKRIRREKEAYNIKKLGAFGSDLAALSHFFETPWSVPASGLLESDEGVLLCWVGFRLRALGRLREAIRPMKGGLDMMIWLREWKQASTAAENLSVLKLTLGQVIKAVNLARQAVEYADKGEDRDRQIYVRYSLADALHQAGDLKEADLWFKEAEKKEKERHSSVRFFYLLGFLQLCERLLSKGKTRGLLSRAAKLKKTANLEGNDLLGEALYYLAYGMISFKKLQRNETKQRSQVKKAFTTAVDGLRASGYQDFLVKSLLSRAAFFRLTGDFNCAATDLEEAREIAEMGDMKLFLCDYLLESARLRRSQGKSMEAQAFFRQAKALIKETGYHRRNSEVES